MNSIRNYLLLYLMLALVSISLITGAITYFTTRHEVSELLDYNLEHIARALEKQQHALESFERSHHALIYEPLSTSYLKPFDAEKDFFIQIWDKSRLIYYSHGLTNFPKPEKNGFAEFEHQGKQWRSYTLIVEDAAVRVSQPLDMQIDMVGEMVSSILIPLAVQLPILALVIWLVVGRSLRPLNAISHAIGKRNSQLLEPLATDDTPTEVRPLVGELNNLLQRLGDTLQVQRQFTADAAHELRTPLTAIQLQLDILQRAGSEADRGIAMQKLSAGIQRSIHLVQQLLLLARLEPETLLHDVAPVDLSGLSKSAVEQFAEQAAAKDIQLHFTSTGKAEISGDAESLRVLVNNLIDNAIRYTVSGGAIEVTVKAYTHTIMLAVADNGVGIPTNERERIFDRFYRVPGSATYGTGLGLAIVKNIVDSHLARITVSEGLGGRGTGFIIHFPQGSRA